jgi:hypothetical protein
MATFIHCTSLVDIAKQKAAFLLNFTMIEGGFSLISAFIIQFIPSASVSLLEGEKAT